MYRPRHRQLSVNSLHQAQAAPRRGRNLLRDTLHTSVFVALILFLITVLVGRFEIQQRSMAPTFSPGQGVLVSQIDWALENWLGESVYASAHSAAQSPLSLRRGQVVVFSETAATVDHPLIKRVIGLPGEQIAISDGQVYINGDLLAEPYLSGIATDCSTVCGPLTLGPGEYFLMGDNRPVSRDSRDFGPIADDLILGRVVARFWPLSEFSLYL